MSKFTPIVYMPVRYWATSYPVRIRLQLLPALFLILLSAFPLLSQESPEAMRKEASRLFEEEQYDKAYKYYSQLVANYPKDPEYNYRLGVCMIYSEPDKKKCIPYLKLAAANPADAPKEVNFYLGKAYHINYKFDDAIRSYMEFKRVASSSLQKKLQVDREIAACNNGKRLLSNLTDLAVLNKKELNEADYFRSYELRKMGKLLVKPDDFKSPVDKKKKENSVVFLPASADLVYYSSYGDDPATGKDIYMARRTADGYSKPEKVKNINTEYDEDYPFLHPDGKTLYFASKGFNSMGGYDIFRSVFNENTQTWGTPENLEFPINSPDDDFLFVTDSLETIAFFSTGRMSPPGKIDVLKVKTKRRPMDIVAIKGTVTKGDADHSLSSVIKVKDTFGDRDLGSFDADDEGKYMLELPGNSKLIFTVETPGLQTQTVQVNIPLIEVLRPLRQTITYESGKLKVTNFFDEKAGEESYLDYLNVIEQKAKLNVNADEKAGATEPLAVSTKGNTPQPVKNNNTTPAKSTSNKELAAMAKKDAEESRSEAAQLQADARDAIETGNKLKQTAEQNREAATRMRNEADGSSDEDRQKLLSARADSLNSAADNQDALSTKILAFGNSLSEDARLKEKEAGLNEQYATELDKAVNSKSPDALKRLEDLQAEIAQVSRQQNSSDNLLNELKSDLESKQKEISGLETNNQELIASLNELKTSISQKDAELAEARKKKDKNRLTEEITSLNEEKSGKEAELASNQDKLAKLNEEVAGVNDELKLATRIKEENISSPAVAKGSRNLGQLREYYGSRIKVTDPDSKNSIQNSINELNSYNEEIDAGLQKQKTLLASAKTPAEKQKASNEIKSLEAQRKQNMTQLSSNFNRITEITKQEEREKVNVESTIALKPVKAENPEEAAALLNELESELKENDSQIFNIPYRNQEALPLRDEANTSLTEAQAKQDKILGEITSTREALKTVDTRTYSEVVTPEQLYTQADELTSQAGELRGKAAKAKGKEQEKLIEQAAALESQALDKNLAASDVVAKDNTAAIATNRENIQNLLKLNRASEQDAAAARKLSDEAVAAFKKAVEIRTEANSLANKGSRLGSYSNAEDQEAEALQKQQNAIDLLMRSAGDFELKPVVTSTTLAKANGEKPKGPRLDELLDKLNASLKELAPSKIAAYEKIYDANQLEINLLKGEVQSRESAAEYIPALKTDLLNARKAITNAEKLREDARSGSDDNDKLARLMTAVGQQNIALEKMGTLVGELDKAARMQAVAPVQTRTVEPVATTTENPVTSSPVTETETPVETASPVAQPEPTVAVLTETTAPAVVQEPVTTENTETEEPVKDGPSRVISIEEIAASDVSSAGIISMITEKQAGMKNPDASAMVKTATGNLKTIDGKLSEVNAALQKIEEAGKMQVAPEVLRSEADTLLAQSEDLADEAEDAKTEASRAKGDQKKALLNEAKELEKRSQDKMMESARVMQTANNKEINDNGRAITELLEKLRNDDPSQVADVEARTSEFESLRNKIASMRADADNQTNTAAKLGAIGNAEEKESELIQKQKQVLKALKSRYPDFVLAPETTPSDEEKNALLEQKKELEADQQTQLINITNAFTLEYETGKVAVPENLTESQKEIRENAEALNAESKRLLIESGTETDPTRKARLLSLAARYGKEALSQMESLLPSANTAVAVNNERSGGIEDETEVEETGSNGDGQNNGGTTQEPAVTTNSPVTTTSGQPTVAATTAGNVPGNAGTGNATINAGLKGLQIVKGNAYSNANPIPIDAPMEAGLVFRVQIGAFKTKIPNNAFKGLTPLNGETTANGYIRYTAGNFGKIEGANAVKNDLKNLGYNDAFVVAYMDGKRISIAQALNTMNEKGITIDPNAPKTAGITSNLNVPRAATSPAVVQDIVAVSQELEKTSGMLLTIQIGVFNRQVTKTQLRGLKPIYSEALNGGLYRYTAGVYKNTEKLLSDKNRIVELGLRDAFASAYLNGKRIPFAEAQSKLQADSSITLQAENPVVFPSASEILPVQYVASTSPATETNVKVFSNGVTAYPAATEENGIKSTEDGICFKVQIGAYNKEVPADIAEKYNAIRNWPVEHKKINALYIYNVGNFKAAANAKALKEDLKKIGLTDVFITVYRDGSKLFGPEAENFLR